MPDRAWALGLEIAATALLLGEIQTPWPTGRIATRTALQRGQGDGIQKLHEMQRQTKPEARSECPNRLRCRSPRACDDTASRATRRQNRRARCPGRPVRTQPVSRRRRALGQTIPGWDTMLPIRRRSTSCAQSTTRNPLWGRSWCHRMKSFMDNVAFPCF